MKFAIGERVYDGADIDRVTLQDILLFDRQVKELNPDLDWAQIEQWQEEIEAIGDKYADQPGGKQKAEKEQSAHPGAIWLMGVAVWMARRGAGEQLEFAEAVNVPMRDLRVIAEPADHKKPANPTRARPATRAGSGRAAKRPAAVKRARAGGAR